ncbi:MULTISPECIES: hypothetical protein [unclassified Pseudomonas]|uniref:hypothetical protein n=1 Tax=unclassified Pseudomonas TaxID=196821 RepID=UPI000C8853CE|nr:MULTISPECIES: hypothetical protein [unclassified Pseudomonas]PNA05004.1 hypothetical protein C1X28_12085 [Pseudomonas sp. FW305-BF15]PNB81230.1 hypothetical protein C1X30_07670 [Pseudomonas sp. FW305-BF6]
MQKLAAAEAPQAPNGVLDTQKLSDAFLLDFFYEEKAANQQIDITIEVKPDRFSIPIEKHARFTTFIAEKEQFSLGSKSLFDYQFKNGSAVIHFIATINGTPQPSDTLELSIVDTI